MNITELQDQLTGTLIGLARATEGNEHAITPETEKAFIQGLLATSSTDEATLAAALETVESAKRALIPDCYACASPCGRTINYDMQGLQKLSREARALKLALLAVARDLAALPRTGPLEQFFYRAVYAVGADDWGTPVLTAALTEAGETIQRRRAALEK